MSIPFASPRLYRLVVGGVALLVAGVGTVLVDPPTSGSTGTLGFRIGVIGFLLVVFGVSGYVTIAVFERGFGS